VVGYATMVARFSAFGRTDQLGQQGLGIEDLFFLSETAVDRLPQQAACLLEVALLRQPASQDRGPGYRSVLGA